LNEFFSTTQMEECLTDLGLTKNEAKAYWTLLRQGPLCARVLARQCQVYRSCAYNALDQLMKKGLVSFFDQKSVRQYQALKPESLLVWYKEREATLKSLLPKLRLEVNLNKNTSSKACMAEGLKAFRILMYDWLSKKSPILVYGIPAKVPLITQYFIEAFHQERIRKKTWMKHIYNQEASARIKYLNKLPCTEAKCLPEAFSSPVSTMICKDEVALIAWEPLTITRIQNEALAKAYEKYFEILWEKAKKRVSNGKIRRR